MIFSSYEFLFMFLPLVLAGYYLLPARYRTLFLTLTSYLFYGWWDYRFCGLMLFSTVIDYVAGKGIGYAATLRGKKQWVALSVVSNLSLLGFFKYFDMFASTLNYGFAALFPESGTSNTETLIPLLHLVLPVGISFYTFQSMSYAIDLYKGRAQPARSFLDFACYVSLFPQLVAGPIVRYHELAEQITSRSHTLAKMARGASFFVVGLAKKVLIADAVAPLTELAFGTTQGPELLNAWVGVLAYTLQIYFDFSGYSDMAVGLGLMFGFQLPINFNSPYKAISITDFWRRWHISLSSWLRDYLYVPLGGNRLGSIRTYINLTATMLLGGLWHGASWTFALWGMYHGVLLAAERTVGKRGLFASQSHMTQKSITFLLVMLGWVLFRAESPAEAGRIYSGLLGLNGMEWVWHPEMVLSFIMMPVALALALRSRNSWEMSHEAKWSWVLVLVVFFVLSVMTLLVNSASPFLYFQF